jgi:hypothetical protein
MNTRWCSSTGSSGEQWLYLSRDINLRNWVTGRPLVLHSLPQRSLTPCVSVMSDARSGVDTLITPNEVVRGVLTGAVP